MTDGGRAGAVASSGYQVVRRWSRRRPGSTTRAAPGPTRQPRPDHQGRRTAVAGDRRRDQRPDVGGGRQHRRRPVAQRRHRGVGSGAGSGCAVRRCARARTGWTRSSAGIRPAVTWRRAGVPVRLPALEATPVSTTAPRRRHRRRRRRPIDPRPPSPDDADATTPTPPRRSPVSWCRRRRTSPASATAASSRRSMPRSRAPRTSAR